MVVVVIVVVVVAQRPRKGAGVGQKVFQRFENPWIINKVCS